ncbi:hypothetical protein CLAFUW4_10719 [Fulvia fulva]|nr:hypothetical protein CLAFUR4_10724 [Fulvia fulva]WPV19149.1 hypothetical protein CLAFUW4_10719 [Fulvia fulva]WPV33819.1 hypothetical protein CLAFUW7_10721 [Fulvia fulva]
MAELEQDYISKSKHMFVTDEGDDILCEIAVSSHTLPCCFEYYATLDKLKQGEAVYDQVGHAILTLLNKSQEDDDEPGLAWMHHMVRGTVPREPRKVNIRQHARDEYGFEDILRYVKLLFDRNGKPKTSLQEDHQAMLADEELLLLDHFSIRPKYQRQGMGLICLNALAAALQSIPNNAQGEKWAYQGTLITSPYPITESTEIIRSANIVPAAPHAVMEKLTKKYGDFGMVMAHKGDERVEDVIRIMIGEIGQRAGRKPAAINTRATTGITNSSTANDEQAQADDIPHGGEPNDDQSDVPTAIGANDNGPRDNTSDSEDEGQDAEERLAQRMSRSSIAPSSTYRYSNISASFKGRRLDPLINALVPISENESKDPDVEMTETDDTEEGPVHEVGTDDGGGPHVPSDDEEGSEDDEPTPPHARITKKRAAPTDQNTSKPSTSKRVRGPTGGANQAPARMTRLQREAALLNQDINRVAATKSNPTYPWYDGKTWEGDEATPELAVEGRHQEQVWKLLHAEKPPLHSHKLPNRQNQAARNLQILGERKGYYFVTWTPAQGVVADAYAEKSKVNGAAVAAWDAKTTDEREMRRRP